MRPEQEGENKGRGDKHVMNNNSGKTQHKKYKKKLKGEDMNLHIGSNDIKQELSGTEDDSDSEKNKNKI